MTGRAIHGRHRLYRPDQREGRYRGLERTISPLLPDLRIAIIDLLYDFTSLLAGVITSVSIGMGKNERAIRGNIAH